MFKYLPHTHADIEAMLDKIGVDSIDDLFSDIPAKLKDFELDVPHAHSELELIKHFKQLANMNKQLVPFMGAGAYDHYTPSIINHLINRQEFLTAYTPYQPEVSQGTLQYIFEYQSMITQLTGMEVSNASMYDGATATAEAMFMCTAIRRKQREILVSETMNPNIINVLKAYAEPQDIKLVMIPQDEGHTDLKALKEKINDNTAGVIVQTPNVYGIIEDYEGYSEVIQEKKALFVINQDPSTLSHLKTPAEYGADIAVGEAQSLGVPLSYGGPYIGYMATLKKHMRKMPGRICGVTKDQDGKRAYVLTLQAREQHIRREKANSNICSNQSLMALFVTIYLSTMGKSGLYEAQQTSFNHAHYLYDMLLKLPQFEAVFDRPFFKEFTLKCNIDTDVMNNKLQKHGFLGPLDQGLFNEKDKGLVTFAVTEKRSKEEMDSLIRILGAL